MTESGTTVFQIVFTRFDVQRHALSTAFLYFRRWLHSVRRICCKWRESELMSGDFRPGLLSDGEQSMDELTLTHRITLCQPTDLPFADRSPGACHAHAALFDGRSTKHRRTLLGS